MTVHNQAKELETQSYKTRSMCEV
uniref:Uncharacterized protein n=1 Tax=Rhizophora mucronata TaxID=61149 RepID=A0A2P2P4C4_RHIMU